VPEQVDELGFVRGAQRADEDGAAIPEDHGFGIRARISVGHGS
jgi:hypothetical protein